MIDIAIVGCGSRVAQHYKKIFKSKKLTNFKISQVCDKNYKKAKIFAKHFNSTPYEDYELMLKKSKSNLIIILTPSGNHYEHAIMALSKNFNILIEKPIALRINHAKKIINLAKRKKLLCSVAFQNRLNPSIQVLKKAIDNKRFGKIISSSVRLRWCRQQEYYDDNWHGRWSQDGGVLNQQGIHHLDALNWLLGPVNSVFSFSTKRLNKLEAEDTIIAAIKLSDGSLSTFEATTAARPRDLEASISITGEKGNVVIGGIALNKIIEWNFNKKKSNDKYIKKKYSQIVPNGYGLSHIQLLKNIFFNIKSKKINCLISGSDTLSTTKLIHAIYASCERNKKINLKDKIESKKLGV